MAEQLIDRALYDAILRFEDSEDAQDYYYKVMDTETVTRSGRRETVRTRILKVYAMLFCEDMDAPPGTPAGPDEVEATADRLYIGEMGLDPSHWYRMRYHFPIIDEDNYDRFAALVISDLSAGPLREAIEKGGDMLLVGEADPLRMTEKQRREQHLRIIDMGGGEASL